MDEDLEQLEAELKRLEPRTPSADATRRIGVELARSRAGRKPADVRWLGLVVLAAAAAVAVMFLRTARGINARKAGSPGSAVVSTNSAEKHEKPPVMSWLKPIADESMLVSARDEGVVTLDDGTRARRQRLEFVETITWKNPRTNASLTWSVPREELRVVPISFQ